MASLRSPNAQSRHKAETARVWVSGCLDRGFKARGESRTVWITLIEAGLIALVVSTIWAIALRSAWWIPVYLVLLVSIFKLPRRRQSPASASNSGDELDAAGLAAFERGSRTDCADGTDEIYSIGQSDVELLSGETADSLGSDPDLPAIGATKPRRNRARVRKASKPTDSAASESAQAVWIRTGPGKFVRASSGVSAADSTQSASTSEPVTEEHGNAPSAFSLTLESLAPVEGSESDLPDTETRATVESDVREETADDQSVVDANPRPRVWRTRVSRSSLAQELRGAIRVAPQPSLLSRRHLSRMSSDARTRVGGLFTRNVTRRAAARRAFGRMPHVQRTSRTRSPPAR